MESPGHGFLHSISTLYLKFGSSFNGSSKSFLEGSPSKGLDPWCKMSDATDEDLRDVFKLLYDDEEEWGGFDDDVSYDFNDTLDPVSVTSLVALAHDRTIILHLML